MNTERKRYEELYGEFTSWMVLADGKRKRIFRCFKCRAQLEHCDFVYCSRCRNEMDAADYKRDACVAIKNTAEKLVELKMFRKEGKKYYVREEFSEFMNLLKKHNRDKYERCR